MAWDLSRWVITVMFIVGIGGSMPPAVSDALELEADLEAADGCVRGEAEFHQQAGEPREFAVEVAGLPPGDEVPVRVAGVVVGRVEINTCGVGELDFEQDPDSRDAAFPVHFPALTGGERVVVGPLSGRLRADTDRETTVLEADLFAAFPSCLRGESELTREAKAQHKFSVEVAGFAPGRHLVVRVAGIKVGTIAIDACGHGELSLAEDPDSAEDEQPFPAHFPQLTGGERVTVGPLRGQLQSED
jgi:hypothetical protein